MAASDDVDLDQVWRNPAGTLAPWIQGLLVAMCIATVVLATKGVVVGFGPYGEEVVRVARRAMLCGLALAFTVAFVPAFRVSRFVRLAALLPVIHFVAVLAGAAVWLAVDDAGTFLYDLNVLRIEPHHVVVAGGLTAVVGWWCAAIARSGRVRFREWLHTTLVFVLSVTFLMGAWIPIVCGRMIGREAVAAWLDLSPHDVRLMQLAALIPPLLVATAFTAVASRWPRTVQRSRDWFGILMVVLLIFTYGSQFTMTETQRSLYIALMPLLLTAVGFANLTLIASGAAEWAARRRVWRHVRGSHVHAATISRDPDEPAGEPVAELEIMGWLRAPRTWTRPFAVRTSAAELPLDGTELVSTVPASTTVLKCGDRIALARTGQEVALCGVSHAADGDPFRSMPRSSDISVVTDLDGASHGFRDVALLMWRPCVAYLMIVLVLSVPVIRALVGALRSW